MNELRLQKIRTEMERENLPQLLISDPASIFYLTGKWIHAGERMLVLFVEQQGKPKLFINELFPVSEDLGVDKVWFNDTQDPVVLISDAMDADGTVGIDKNWPSRFLLRLMELRIGGAYVNGSVLVDRVRMRKDEEERALMREASRLNDLGMGQLIRQVSEKHRERDMAGILGAIYEELQADGFSFDPIIAYGSNAADPHHEPDNSLLQEGDSIILDIGCKKNSYCADMTRTVFYKSASDKAREIYGIVLEANRRAIAAVKPGVRFCDIDAAARGYIEEKGYGRFFTHRTGHSIGIDVHDFGDVSAVNTATVEAGMIFSIEPGIYLSGEVGVRIEDLVLVTETGCEVLNEYDKGITIIG